MRMLPQIPLSIFTQRKEKKAAPAEPESETSDAELPEQAAPIPKKKPGRPRKKTKASIAASTAATGARTAADDAKVTADAAEKAHHRAQLNVEEKKKVLDQLSAANPRDAGRVSKAKQDMKAAKLHRDRTEGALKGAEDKFNALDQAAIILETISDE